MATSVCLLQTEIAKLCLFSANGKRNLVFLGRQTINSNQHLLFQQTCPPLVLTEVLAPVTHSTPSLGNCIKSNICTAMAAQQDLENLYQHLPKTVRSQAEPSPPPPHYHTYTYPGPCQLHNRTYRTESTTLASSIEEKKRKKTHC
jgi:hypothetical protein